MVALSIVLPCYNEAEAIPSFLEALKITIFRLKEQGQISECQVIVVDDASIDETPALLRNYPWVNIVSIPCRSGYGSALKTGFEHCFGDWIAFMDIDGTYDPADLELFLNKIKGSQYDLAFGKRPIFGQGMTAVRGLGNLFFTGLVRLLYRRQIGDVCSGFRVFKKSLLREISDFSNNGLDFSLAITLWAMQKKLSVLEIPIFYHPRKGRSKLSVFIDGNRFLWTIFQSQWGYFRPRSTSQQ